MVDWLIDEDERRSRVRRSADHLSKTVYSADVEFLLIVPPFASPDRPSLGGSLVVTASRRAGCSAKICYANLSFAHLIGVTRYRRLCHTPTSILFGERVFSPAYYGTRQVGYPAELDKIDDLLHLQTLATEWCDAVADVLASSRSKYIGLSTSFEQTLSSLALISKLKSKSPDKIVLVGGANADGEMGGALAAVEKNIDHVFCGEAESEVYRFFRDREECSEKERVIRCLPIDNIENADCPDYDDFFEQIRGFALLSPEMETSQSSELHLPYESSRGCWWGAKHHCTFCGLNANGMNFRQKSPGKVMTECSTISDLYGINKIVMTDNIMPSSYFSTLLKEISAKEKKFTLFYEQKANITHKKMRMLKLANVTRIQPGIESLSTSVLKLMKKGTTAANNIACLRFARAEGIDLAWNLLCDFPGDAEQDYIEMNSFVPLLHHLQPPSGVSPLMVDRFSPYFDKPNDYQVTGLRPLPAYSAIHPSLNKDQIVSIAYHFEAEYDSAKRRSPECVRNLALTVNEWIDQWSPGHKPLPEFRIFDLDDSKKLLIDTRDCRHSEASIVDEATSRLLLHGTRNFDGAVRGALDRRELLEIDGAVVPIAVHEGDFIGGDV